MALSDWQARLQALVPGCSVTKTQALSGGVSAQMTRVDLVLNEQHQSLIVRSFGKGAPCGQVLARERAIIDELNGHGFPTTRVLHAFDCDLGPCLALEWREASPKYHKDFGQTFVNQAAPVMAQLHNLPVTRAIQAMLPDAESMISALMARESCQEWVNEERLRKALCSAKQSIELGPEKVWMHGDLWPGNVLFSDQELNAVIDWEESRLGPNLLDLCITRLDLTWIFGAEIRELWTAKYLSLRPCSTANLAFFDALAALRPGKALSLWAQGFKDLGRPDITVDTMSQDLCAFADQALVKLTRDCI